MHSLMDAFCSMCIHFIVKLCLLLSAETMYIALFVTSNIQGDYELMFFTSFKIKYLTLAVEST